MVKLNGKCGNEERQCVSVASQWSIVIGIGYALTRCQVPLPVKGSCELWNFFFNFVEEK